MISKNTDTNPNHLFPRIDKYLAFVPIYILYLVSFRFNYQDPIEQTILIITLNLIAFLTFGLIANSFYEKEYKKIHRIDNSPIAKRRKVVKIINQSRFKVIIFRITHIAIYEALFLFFFLIFYMSFTDLFSINNIIISNSFYLFPLSYFLISGLSDLVNKNLKMSAYSLFGIIYSFILLYYFPVYGSVLLGFFGCLSVSALTMVLNNYYKVSN